jgi:hypothetical protein
MVWAVLTTHDAFELEDASRVLADPRDVCALLRRRTSTAAG